MSVKVTTFSIIILTDNYNICKLCNENLYAF
jgi:hypothetical protein